MIAVEIAREQANGQGVPILPAATPAERLLPFVGMSNGLSEEKRQQVIALGPLGCGGSRDGGSWCLAGSKALGRREQAPEIHRRTRWIIQVPARSHNLARRRRYQHTTSADRSIYREESERPFVRTSARN